MLRYLSEAQKEREKGNVEATTCYAINQVIEQSEFTLDSVDEINESVLDSIGFCVPCNNKPLRYDWADNQKMNTVVLEHTLKNQYIKLINLPMMR